MRKVAFPLAMLLLAVPVSAQKGGDEQGVREVVRKYVEAREKGDAKGVEALFAPDADQLVSNGEWRKGREAVVKGSLASSQSNSGHRTIDIDAVRFIAPDVAIADGSYEISGPTVRKMRTTFVMTHAKEGWRIRAIRNMLPSPQAAPARP